MKPQRLTLTNHLVLGYGLHKHMDIYQPHMASKEEMEAFHDADYIEFLSRYVCVPLADFSRSRMLRQGHASKRWTVSAERAGTVQYRRRLPDL